MSNTKQQDYIKQLQIRIAEMKLTRKKLKLYIKQRTAELKELTK